LLVLFYFNWIGTTEELKKFTDRATGIINGIEGVKLWDFRSDERMEFCICCEGNKLR
jgi:hypothetical protein